MKTIDARSARWLLDPMHTTVTFSVRHLMITTVHGVFEDVRGIVQYDREAPEKSAAQIEIAAASVHTHQPLRDAHLRNADFFDVERHPTIAFRSTRAGVIDGRLRELGGALTLRGITREVALSMIDISDEQIDHHGRLRMGASACGRIRRSDFGMTYNWVPGRGGVAVGDEVTLQLDISLIRADPRDPALRSMLRGDGRAESR